ncbi:hypothetical protein SEA_SMOKINGBUNNY_64 [Gordonia phage SmokingBunny]|uniref:Uncharacterized protein n=2 Tax=Wizardvirus TaxID=2169658 RepID=A0A515MHM5_9CAUD|nr:hypothetical protein KNU53_gp64 [Gordonia phage SmokingBunny]YP_010103077.1 hypothetical protein KNU63_gp67 [Gordonia phage RogerDodger]QCG77875.1 hypothetical protein SEA_SMOKINGBUNNY_64 [Gordonia phage SmokingBunny]QDM56149.1 hypothetical protein SEA_ROGERDODGER_67 [Gordonia phage RogerDodger]WAA20281.1 hypothetical protein SEA_TOGO_63 [Gordonia phage Togo]
MNMIPPILDRSILDTTAEYPVVFSAVFQDVESGAPELRVARVDLDNPPQGEGGVPVARPSRIGCTTFTLTRAADDPEQLTVTAHAGRGLGFSILGLAHTKTIPSWPITLGEIPPDAGGGVWAMIACPRDVTLAFIDGPGGAQ